MEKIRHRSKGKRDDSSTATNFSDVYLKGGEKALQGAVGVVTRELANSKVEKRRGR